jgi:Ca-activated chloride channel family protein
VDTAEKAFAAIDAAQKIEFQAKSYLLTTELFHWCVIPGATLLFLGALAAVPPQLPFRRKRVEPTPPRGLGTVAAK